MSKINKLYNDLQNGIPFQLETEREKRNRIAETLKNEESKAVKGLSSDNICEPYKSSGMFDNEWSIDVKFDRRLANIGGNKISETKAKTNSNIDSEYKLTSIIGGPANGVYGGKYGFVDASYRVIIPFIYSYAKPFDVDGIALVSKSGSIDKGCYGGTGQKGGGWGYIDIDGKEVIPLEYEYTMRCDDDYILVQKKSMNQNSNCHKSGVYNSKGDLIVPVIYDYIGVNMGDGRYGFSFPQNLIPVMINGNFAVYDLQGTLVVPFMPYGNDTQEIKRITGLDFNALR